VNKDILEVAWLLKAHIWDNTKFNISAVL